MWDAATEVLTEHRDASPVLRAMLDHRYQLWEPVDGLQAGSLPVGTDIWYRSEHRLAKGRVRAPHQSPHPRRSVNVAWEGDHWAWKPELGLDQVVSAWLPVPLDASALIAVVAAENNMPIPAPRRPRRTRPATDWNDYDACTQAGCWASAGNACIDVRSAWSTRRQLRRPHPGRPHTAAVATR
jgi:hypothetical protein